MPVPFWIKIRMIWIILFGQAGWGWYATTHKSCSLGKWTNTSILIDAGTEKVYSLRTGILKKKDIN